MAERPDQRIDLKHMTPKERLGEQIATLAARIDAATYQLLVLIRTFDEQEGWTGFASCAHWLAWRVGLAPGAARERVRVARALVDLPLISQAMRRGQLSYSKVRALTRVARPDTEESLVDLGRAGTAAHVEQTVRAWRRIDSTVEAREDELRDAMSTISTHIDENGMFVIRGRLAPEAGEVLMKALAAAREKLYDKDADDRPPVGKQRADALALVAENALAGGLTPTHSGDRYQVVVHVEADGLQRPEPVPQAVESGNRVPGLPASRANAPGTEAGAHRVPAETRTHSRSAESDGSMANGAAATGSSGAAARTSAARVPAGTCKGCVSADTSPAPARPDGAWLGDSHIRVSAETARRLSCEAATVRMTHRNGEILSVGRKSRTIPPPIRRALEFRDQSCRFPGCTSKHCDAHHVEHWSDGGETKLSNLVLLCRRHHRLLHEGGCSVRLNARGDAQFFDRRGRALQQSPEPPPIGLHAAEDLVRQLEDAGILITGTESMPAWDGRPFDLRYAMEVLWRPPPGQEASGAAAPEPTRS